MNILFVFSACFWSYIVGRCIAFGPVCRIFTWYPQFPPDSWYCLTHIPARMPVRLVQGLPFVLTVLSIPGLLVNNTLIHSTTVLLTTNDHCYIPIFTSRIYDSMAVWSVVSAAAYACMAYSVSNAVVATAFGVKCFIFLWFTWMEMKIKGNIIREELPYEERQPRTV